MEFQHKGRSAMQAVAHRKKARATGEISLITPRATTKFPDHTIVARTASKIPFRASFLNLKRSFLYQLNYY